MIKIIIVAVVIWALVKIFAPPKKKGGNSGSGTQPNRNAMKQAAKQTVDQSIVDRIMLVVSTAIEMAYIMQQGKPHGAFIRCSADDFNGKSWAEVSTSVFNIHNGWSELEDLEREKTLENARKFLSAAGFQNVSANDFFRCVQIAKIEKEKNTGSLTMRYEPTIPSGAGTAYHAELVKRLREKWSHLHFEYDEGDIDLHIS